MPCAALQGVGGELDVCCRTSATALSDEVTRAAFALAALGGNTQFELNLLKTQPRTGVAGDFAVGDSAADTDDHGLACWWIRGCVNYKCESVAFAINLIMQLLRPCRLAFCLSAVLPMRCSQPNRRHDDQRQ